MSDNDIQSFEWQDIEHREPLAAIQVGPLACSCFLLPEDGAGTGPEKSSLLPGAGDSSVDGSSHVCRMIAAGVVIKENFKDWSLQVQLYRMFELVSSTVLFGVMTWILRPFAMIILAVIFWYLPPAYIMQSYTKLFFTPFVLFAVKCSVIGIYPTQASAKFLFKCGIVRAIFLILVPFLVLLIPMPLMLKDSIMHKDAFNAFLGKSVEGWKMILFHFWDLFAIVTLLLSLAWVVLTFLVLQGRLWRSNYTPLHDEQDQSVAKKIEDLKVELQKACDLPPEDCRQELENLKKTRPELKLVTWLSTIGGLASVLGSLAGDFANAFTCFRQLFIVSGLVLASYAISEVMFIFDIGGPSHLYSELKLSHKRGLYTDDFWKFLHMMKGARTAFKLTVKVCSLPWAADGLISGAIAVATILESLHTTAQFAYQQYDLAGEPMLPTDPTLSQPSDAGV